MKTMCQSFLVAALLVLTTVAAEAQPTLLVDGLAGGSGSAVGPHGRAVSDGGRGRPGSACRRANRRVTTFASGLPPFIIGIGGAMDVVFIGNTAYVLVTLVATDLNGVFGPGTVPEPGNVVGIYQIDGCDRTRFRRAADGRRPVRAWPQAVLAGTVLSIEPLPNPSCEQVMAHQRIRFQVQKAWRGGVSGVVEIRTGAGGGDCG